MTFSVNEMAMAALGLSFAALAFMLRRWFARSELMSDQLSTKVDTVLGETRGQTTDIKVLTVKVEYVTNELEALRGRHHDLAGKFQAYLFQPALEAARERRAALANGQEAQPLPPPPDGGP